MEDNLARRKKSRMALIGWMELAAALPGLQIKLKKKEKKNPQNKRVKTKKKYTLLLSSSAIIIG